MDLTLYLVTDSNPVMLNGKDIVQVVDEAIRGGVTIVQYREKHADTGEMVEIAAKLHAVTKKHNVPLIINDRIDVCQAIRAEGVHIGQDDMNAVEVRRILGPDAIIGVSASSVEQAHQAIKDGADYLGLGAAFATPTKEDTKSIIGTQGLQSILEACSTGSEKKIPCVAIGGINKSNIQRVLHQSTYQSNSLNGVAVVSAIVAASDPQSAARELKELISATAKRFYTAVAPGQSVVSDVKEMVKLIPSIITTHFKSSVLSHNMTNTVVQNFAANVCLATGSSPIMSLNPDEASDLAKLGGGLVINMGTVTPEVVEAYLAGTKAYNSVGNPVLFDPVGGGATEVRKALIKKLLKGSCFSVIKGNEGEISAVAGSTAIQQRGVDSGPSTTSSQEKADLVEKLAQRERCIVLMTGATDYLSDGDRTLAISNGSYLLGKITGSGCALGAIIAGYLAVHKEDKLLATLAGIMHYEIAAERAEANPSCKGPGSFIPTFLDELHLLGKEISEGGQLDLEKISKIKIIR